MERSGTTGHGNQDGGQRGVGWGRVTRAGCAGSCIYALIGGKTRSTSQYAVFEPHLY